ncbi:pitrilysin family protein [Phenylobacterium sp.]|uniref:M16 family metallopeptidase n=1 Tax=Phenylobacterium sp. TaxID=1871053 RepID=UPI002730A0D2|nr:pitrilysin family protein [Phenylobacterium sp.]MDP2212554.1 pitrilysin family protein [Phenylobacterium sp.]
MPGLETTALCVVAGRGARFEDEARSGWSHLLEHMVFKGAGQRSAMEIVEAIEAQGGQINAATGYERTSFQVRCLAGGLPLGAAVLADLVLAPRLDTQDLTREKQVVGQEIAEAADTPDDLVFEMAQTAAYGDQPLGRSILGTVPSIGGAEPQSLADWRARLYDPAALVVSAAGAVEEAELLDLAEQHFGAATAPDEGATSPDATFQGGESVAAKPLEQANLVFLLPAVGVSHPDYFVLRLFAEILGGGMASRLFQEAREKRGLAYAVDAYSETYADQGVLGVFAGCAAKDATELAKVAAAEIAGLGDSVTAVELARAKAQIKGAMFMMRESPLARAEQTAAQLLLFDRPLPPAEIAAGIERVSLEDLARLGDGLRASGRVAVSVLGPRQAAGAAKAFRQTLFG